MLTDQAIARQKYLDEQCQKKREQALLALQQIVNEEKNALIARRAREGWEKRRAAGYRMSDEAKHNISIGKRDQRAGERHVMERHARLEKFLLGLGYSIEEIRAI
jgi:hypothetical protein